MKNRFFVVLLVALFGFLSMGAKDIINKKDGSTVACQVVEITETTVKYRPIDNPSGPIYNIPITSIKKIVYQNGKIDIFDANLKDPTVVEAAPYQDASQLPYSLHQVSMNDARLLALDASQNNTGLRNQAKNFRIIGWTVGPVLFVAGCVSLYLSEGSPVDNPASFFGGLSGMVVGAATCVTCNMIAHSKYKKADRVDLMSISVGHEVLKMGDKSLCFGVNYSKDNFAHISSFGPSLSVRF